VTSLSQLVDALQGTPNDPIQDLKDAIKATLVTTFSKVPVLSGANGETQPIAQFLSGGKLLLQPPNLSSVNKSMVTTVVR
jgi:hypothetical protein